jgi:hypothetical protein
VCSYRVSPTCLPGPLHRDSRALRRRESISYRTSIKNQQLGALPLHAYRWISLLQDSTLDKGRRTMSPVHTWPAFWKPLTRRSTSGHSAERIVDQLNIEYMLYVSK